MKRLISWVLTLVMILGMVPAISLATGAESYTVMENVLTVLDTTRYAEDGRAYEGVWTPFFPLGTTNEHWPAWETREQNPTGYNYAEIVKDGYADAGSLHFVRGDVYEHIGLAIDIGLVPGNTYTLTANVKSNAAASFGGLQLYSHGDPVIATFGDGQTFANDGAWHEVSLTFTANKSALQLYMNAGAYTTDVYVDNLKVTDASGTDMLAGKGNFSVFTEVEKDSAVSGEMADYAGLDATVWAAGGQASTDVWRPFTPYEAPRDDFPAWATEGDYIYAEIIADGYRDAGSLHMTHADIYKHVGVAIDAGMIPGNQYTLKAYVKGRANATYQGLQHYGNGDGTIATFSYEGDDWHEVTSTFTADRSILQLFLGGGAYTSDIYIDNITLTDTNGVNLLAGRGDFCTDYVDPNWIAVPDTIDTSKSCSTFGGAPTDGWYKAFYNGAAGGAWPEWNENVYGEIVAEGNQNAGALHLKNVIGSVTSVGIGVDTVAGQQYTLGLWAKGTSNSGRVLCDYADGVENVIIATDQDISADTWNYYEISYTAGASKQVTLSVWSWGESDIYIDNVTLKDANGVDLLKGHGDFFHYETKEPDVPDVSVTAGVLDLTRRSWEKLSHSDAWTQFFPNGIAEGDWLEWTTEGDSYIYADIVAEGHSDAGSLHFNRADMFKHIGVAIDAGMTIGATYTVKAFVKGRANSDYQDLMLNGNGGATVATFSFNGDDWHEITATFTADRTTFELVLGGGAWKSEIYVDDLQILDAKGNDILNGKGNFSVIEEDIPDLAVISSEAERSYRWYWNASGLGGVELTPSVNNDVEILAEGCKDPGALYLWQNTALQDVLLTLIPTQAKDLTNGQTYTLSMNVKGTFANNELLSVFPGYLNQDEAKASFNIPGKMAEMGYAGYPMVVPEWTTVTFELPYNSGENGFTYLNLFMSKYTWGTHCYIDNIQILDPDGNDVLGGAGNFMDSGSESYPIRLVKPEVEVQNSNTMYYMGYFDKASVNVKNHEETILFSKYTFGDQNFSVTHNGTTQSASSKNVTMNMASTRDGMPVIFSITSTKGIVVEDKNHVDEINIYDVTFSNYDNSVETLTLGKQELGFAWGDADGYSYTYTATARGTLNVAVESGNVSVLLNGTVANAIDVNAGDAVTVTVKPNQNENGGYVATGAVISSTWEEKLPTIDSTSLVLGDILNLNISTTDAQDCTLRATISGKTQNVTAVNGVYTVVLPAHRLHEAVSLELLDGDTVVATETWTMADYSAKLRDEHKEDTKLLTLLTALENYGTYAAYYANPTGTAPNVAAVEAVTRDKLENCQLSISKYDTANLNAVVSLYLDDACDLLLKLDAEAFAGLTLVIDGNTVTPTIANGKAVYIISNILPQGWGEAHSIQVLNGEQTVFGCSYSVLSYAYIALGRSTEAQTGLNGMLKAMYLYSQAACDYLTK